jgi:hypothetical protein
MYLWKALGDHLRGAVGRAVVHDNSLEAPERLCPKQMKEALNERLPIEDGKNDIDIRAANRIGQTVPTPQRMWTEGDRCCKNCSLPCL